MLNELIEDYEDESDKTKCYQLGIEFENIEIGSKAFDIEKLDEDEVQPDDAKGDGKVAA